jgi:DNA processing protein
VSVSSDSIADWIVLISAPGIGPRTATRLLERYGTPRAVADASRQDLAAAGISSEAITALKQPDAAALERILAWAEQPDAFVLTRADARYPPLLAEIPDAPLLLYVRGDPELLAEPQIAVVGSRNPTPSGLEITRDFARRLAADGLLITSGLALGVDGAAHAGALETGRTIAVLGTGPDLVYPATHRDLARRIAERRCAGQRVSARAGTVGAEFPAAQPDHQRALRRCPGHRGGAQERLLDHRTLRARARPRRLCRARLDPQSPLARQPRPDSRRCQAGRGSRRDPPRAGPDAAQPARGLSRRGVRAARRGAAVARGGIAALDADYRALLDAMGFDPVAPDELIASSGRSAREVSSMLLVLELEGHVSSAPGGRFCRLGP